MMDANAPGSNGAAGPFLIVSSPDEVQRLALRGIDALEKLGSHEPVDPYLGRLGLTTPRTVKLRGDVAGQLHACGIELRYLSPGFDLERDDPAQFVGEAVFARPDGTDPHFEEAGATASECGLRVLTLAELLTRPFPEREPILTPWLPTQSLSMIYAWRGVGKTHVALAIAYAVASAGAFLTWRAPRPRRVLYIDGEMPAPAIQGRLRALVEADDREFDTSNLLILTPDVQNGPMPDLATREGQEEVDAFIATAGVELIVVDNISTLCRNTASENDEESWRAPQAWALRHRTAGRSVLFIHHSGKGGAQRGSSKREDTLDVSIALKRPADYQAEEGARFEIHFEKYRNGVGEEAKPIEAKLTTDGAGRATWTWRTVDDSTFDRVVALANDGLRPGEIAAELGINKSNVSRHLKRARADGLVAKGGP